MIPTILAIAILRWPVAILAPEIAGQVATNPIIHNNTAKAGDLLYLTKPLGVGILTSALKKERIWPQPLKPWRP